MESIGVLPAYTIPSKRDLLFFDRFISATSKIEYPASAHPNLRPFTRHGAKNLAQLLDWPSIRPTFEYLKERKLLSEFSEDFQGLLLQTDAQLAKELEYQERWEALSGSYESSVIAIQRQSTAGHKSGGGSGGLQALLEEVKLQTFLDQARARLIALNFSTDTAVCTPLLSELSSEPGPPRRNDEVLQVLLKRFPAPAEEVSFEEIFAFKSESKVHRQLELLRRWVRKGIADEKKTPAMIGEELADSLSDFAEQMKLAKMKYRTEVVQILLTAPLATIERVAKLQFSQLLDPIFSLAKARIALLEAEAKAPGRELAFVETVSQRFGGKK